MNDHQHHLKFLFPLRAATRSDDPRTPCFSTMSLAPYLQSVLLYFLSKFANH